MAERNRNVRVNRTGRTPQRPSRPRRGQTGPALPEWEVAPRSLPPRPRRPEASAPRREERRPRPGPRQKPPMRPGARRALTVFAVLVMTALTLLLAATLLFRISQVTVTGDAIPGLSPADAAALCGYKEGDNLLFIATKGPAKELSTVYPYVEKAEITRKFPDTVEIRLTAAHCAAALEYGSQWVLLNAAGKTLELTGEPPEGVMRVFGTAISQAVPGETAALTDEETQQALFGVLSGIENAKAGGLFTAARISGAGDLRLLYQDRIQFRLGGTLSLDYKIELGCRAAEDLDPKEAGVLDLTSAGETRRAVFTSGDPERALFETPAPAAGDASAGAPAPTDPEGTSGDAAGTEGDDGENSDAGTDETGGNEVTDGAEGDTWDEDAGDGDAGEA